MKILLHGGVESSVLRYHVIRGIGAALVAATAMLPTVADAQLAGYPAKPVRVIVPFPAGGPVEILARVFTQRLASSGVCTS